MTELPRRSGQVGAAIARVLLVLAVLGSALALYLSRERAAPAAGLSHLLPVSRADNLPTAQRAAEARVLQEVLFREGLVGWTLHRAEVEAVELASPGASERGLSGFVVRPLDERVDLGLPQVKSTRLEWAAADISELVVRASFHRAGTARIFFRTAADEEQQLADQAELIAAGHEPTLHFPANQYVECPTRKGNTLADLSFAVSAHSAWRGTVRALRLDLVQRSEVYVLDRLQAVKRQLAPGASPTRLGERLLDSGLVTVALDERDQPDQARYESRRAFPAFAGEDQYVHLSLDGPSTLHFSCALPPDVELDGPVTFELWSAQGDVVVAAADSLRDPSAWPHESSFVRRQALLCEPLGEGGSWISGRLELEEQGPMILLLRTYGGRGEGDVNGMWGPLTLQPRVYERPPSVVLITADTVRADHVGIYDGIEQLATPNIDALGLRGSLFLDTLAPCNATSPSHATILTGLYPKDHRVLGNQTLLPEEIGTLAERMRAAGYVTIASSSVRHLNSDYSGLGQGVDVYFDTPPPIPGPPTIERDAPPWLPSLPAPYLREAYRGASAVHAQLLPMLEELDDRPFFLWVHYYDPHTPYIAREEFQSRQWSGAAQGAGAGPSLLEQFSQQRVVHNPHLADVQLPDDTRHEFTPDELRRHYELTHPHVSFLGATVDPEYPRAMYRAGIEQLDADLAELFGALEARREELYWVFTSDHGEGLGERDIWFDHQGVYDETLRVPLILAGPGVPAGVRVQDPVELVDIVPTIYELLDLPAAPVLRGRSLVGALHGESLAPKKRWFQYAGNLEAGWQDEHEHVVVSLMDHPRGSFDVPITEDKVELYDRGSDPALVEDLAPAAAARAQRAREVVLRGLAARAPAVDARASAMDAATLEHLGYGGQLVEEGE